MRRKKLNAAKRTLQMLQMFTVAQFGCGTGEDNWTMRSTWRDVHESFCYHTLHQNYLLLGPINIHSFAHSSQFYLITALDNFSIDQNTNRYFPFSRRGGRHSRIQNLFLFTVGARRSVHRHGREARERRLQYP